MEALAIVNNQAQIHQIFGASLKSDECHTVMLSHIMYTSIATGGQPFRDEESLGASAMQSCLEQFLANATQKSRCAAQAA
ncbi:expressed unknown protein [Seminavis robusta]|nr:expressed unknown protein [Seminavis robusta]|eukprot:Sro1459_g274550.1 n/a (80) ;mRNA; f:26144-26383